jgi:hypothetical protein
MRAGSVIVLIYIVAGVIVAAMNGYFEGVGNVTGILEALVAVVAWPLVLIGVDINFAGDLNGGGGGGNGGGGGGNGGGNGGGGGG